MQAHMISFIGAFESMAYFSAIKKTYLTPYKHIHFTHLC